MLKTCLRSFRNDSSLSSTIPYHLTVFSVICTYQTARVRRRIVEGEGSITRECFKKNLGKEQTDTERRRQRAFFCRKKAKNAFLLAVRFVLTSKSPWITLRMCLNEVMWKMRARAALYLPLAVILKGLQCTSTHRQADHFLSINLNTEMCCGWMYLLAVAWRTI